jgi:hypothetical protein
MTGQSARIPSFPLRLPKTTRVQADRLAERQGVSLNEFIRVAVAEKISRLEPLISTETAQDEKDEKER